MGGDPNDPTAGYPVAETSAVGTLYVSVIDTDAEPGDLTMTPERLLGIMKRRLAYYGTPLPDGYVAPPGIDVAALLRKLGWPRPDAPPPA